MVKQLDITYGTLEFVCIQAPTSEFSVPAWAVQAKQIKEDRVLVWHGRSRTSLYGALLDAIQQGEEAGWLKTETGGNY